MMSFLRNIRLLLLVLFSFLLAAPAAHANKQLTPEQVRDRIIHRGVSNRVHVLLKDGNEFYGKILSISPDHFRMQQKYDPYSFDIYGPQTTDVYYNEVLTLRAGMTAGEKWATAGMLAGVFGLAAFGIAWGIHESHQMRDDYNKTCAQMWNGVCPNPAVRFSFGH